MPLSSTFLFLSVNLSYLETLSRNPVATPEQGIRKVFILLPFLKYKFSSLTSSPAADCLQRSVFPPYLLWPTPRRDWRDESHCPSCRSLQSLHSYPQPNNNLFTTAPPYNSTSFTGNSNSWFSPRIPLALSSLSFHIILCLTATDLQDPLFPPV